MRVLIADGQTTVRYALCVLLGNQAGVDIVGEAGDAGELMLKPRKTYPDLILLDWELPGLSAESSLTRLRRYSPDLVVIALSGRLESGREARSAGVNAFVSKVEPPQRLLAEMDRFRYRVQTPAVGLIPAEV